MNETELEDIRDSIGSLALFVIIICIVCIVLACFTYNNWKSTDKVNTKIESMSSDIASLNGDMTAVKYDTKETKNGLHTVRQNVYDEIHEIQIAKSAKIYNLEITVCKENLLTNNIDKRFVRMNNIVAINPSVERTAITVDTGIDYNGVIIPGVLEDEKSYACNLRILSVR